MADLRRFRLGSRLGNRRDIDGNNHYRHSLGALLLHAGELSFWPFGRDIVSRDELTGREDMGTGALGLIGNIIWFILCGWWLAVWHIVAAVALAITIIGIPFALQHVKLALASLFPIGKTVVEYDEINAARRSQTRPNS